MGNAWLKTKIKPWRERWWLYQRELLEWCFLCNKVYSSMKTTLQHHSFFLRDRLFLSSSCQGDINTTTNLTSTSIPKSNRTSQTAVVIFSFYSQLAQINKVAILKYPWSKNLIIMQGLFHRRRGFCTTNDIWSWLSYQVEPWSKLLYSFSMIPFWNGGSKHLVNCIYSDSEKKSLPYLLFWYLVYCISVLEVYCHLGMVCNIWIIIF